MKPRMTPSYLFDHPSQKLWGRLPGLGNGSQAMIRIVENFQNMVIRTQTNARNSELVRENGVQYHFSYQHEKIPMESPSLYFLSLLNAEVRNFAPHASKLNLRSAHSLKSNQPFPSCFLISSDSSGVFTYCRIIVGDSTTQSLLDCAINFYVAFVLQGTSAGAICRKALTNPSQETKVLGI